MSTCSTRRCNRRRCFTCSTWRCKRRRCVRAAEKTRGGAADATGRRGWGSRGRRIKTGGAHRTP
eukprot:3770139-Prymnesium_polylepis.2